MRRTRNSWSGFALLGFVGRLCLDVLASAGLWWKRPALHEIRFPVIAIRADHSHAFVAATADDLREARGPTADYPSNGTILIDSDFNLYAERRVRPAEGELGMTFRVLLGLRRNTAYKLALRRCWRSGSAAAHAHLARVQSFGGGDADDAARRRTAIAAQPTMAGIVAVLDEPIAEPRLA